MFLTMLMIARTTVRTIKTNLFWSLFYNVTGLGLALFDLLHPILAAGVMVVSSPLVDTLSLRPHQFDQAASSAQS